MVIRPLDAVESNPTAHGAGKEALPIGLRLLPAFCRLPQAF